MPDVEEKAPEQEFTLDDLKAILSGHSKYLIIHRQELDKLTEQVNTIADVLMKFMDAVNKDLEFINFETLKHQCDAHRDMNRHNVGKLFDQLEIMQGKVEYTYENLKRHLGVPNPKEPTGYKGLEIT